MKSLTSHRIGLSKERMSMFEEAKPNNFSEDDLIPQYSEAEKQSESKSENELDVLYKNVGKAFIKSTTNKTPGVYFGVGFVCGVIFILVVFGIVALSSKGQKDINIPNQENESIQKIDNNTTSESEVQSDEKYVIQSGDTLDKIVVKKYGQYSEEKINKIQEINNITNPSKLQIGQVIVLPAE